MKHIIKTLLSLVLITAAVFCFVLPKKTINQREHQITGKHKTVKITENEGLKNFLEYIGLFLLVITAWQWRKELGFDSFGFISKQPEISGTNPDDRDSDAGDIPPSQPSTPTLPLLDDIKSTKEDKDYLNFQLHEKLKEIISILENNPNSITNANIISNKIGVSIPTAERYLFELLKRNIIRKDTFPGSRSSIYSLASSFDNRAIDYFINERIAKDENVIGDYRYVRLKSKYEIDAIVKTDLTNYVIELKYYKSISINVLSRGVEQLIKIEEHLDLQPINLVLIIVVPRQSIKQIEQHSFAGKRNLKIQLIEEEKITTPKST
jgi:DNA-binding Lrp family transcriptional regulator